MKKKKIWPTKSLAVGAGGHHSRHTVFRRCAAPKKVKIVPFGKLWVNSLEAATAESWEGCEYFWGKRVVFLGGKLI